MVKELNSRSRHILVFEQENFSFCEKLNNQHVFSQFRDNSLSALVIFFIVELELLMKSCHEIDQKHSKRNISTKYHLLTNQNQGAKLLGFRFLGRLKNDAGNPKYGPWFPTGNPEKVV